MIKLMSECAARHARRSTGAICLGIALASLGIVGCGHKGADRDATTPSGTTAGTSGTTGTGDTSTNGMGDTSTTGTGTSTGGTSTSGTGTGGTSGTNQ